MRMKNTLDYYSYLSTLPDLRKQLPDVFNSAKYAIVVDYLAGSSFTFRDENDEEVMFACKAFA
jgi:hypothetical protein